MNTPTNTTVKNMGLVPIHSHCGMYASIITKSLVLLLTEEGTM